jgi:pilus assembly protein CpaC
LKNANATVVGTTVFLEGSVESKEELRKAELITKAVGEQVENLLTVGIKRMVLTEVDFVEIKKSSFDTIGIKLPLDWTGTIEMGQPDATSGVTNLIVGPQTRPDELLFTITGTADWRLGMQFNDGYGRTLARPKLVCASGESAEFVAGGEVPLVSITLNVIDIRYKEFGVKLKISPTADMHGNISTQIEAEVSDIDESLTVEVGSNRFPGFSVTRARTNVTVRHGETIVLSGLFNNTEQKNVSKFPFLGHIPILGELFKSRTFRDKKSELVVFVTPRIVNPASERIIRTIQEIKDRYQRAKEEVEFSIFD